MDADALELEFLFVQGMPLVFREREGHETWEIANGRRGKAYSFMHEENGGVRVPEEALRDDAGGKVFTIDQPKIVCVLLNSLSGTAPDEVGFVVPVEV